MSRNTAEVFVVLSDVNDVEKVLKTCGKRIDSNIIKMFRSCREQVECRCSSPDSALSKSPEFDNRSDSSTEKRSSQEIETSNMNAEWIRVAPEIFPSKETKPLDADVNVVQVFVQIITNEEMLSLFTICTTTTLSSISGFVRHI